MIQANPYAGIIQIRFYGYNLRLLPEPPHVPIAYRGREASSSVQALLTTVFQKKAFFFYSFLTIQHPLLC